MSDMYGCLYLQFKDEGLAQAMDRFITWLDEQIEIVQKNVTQELKRS